MTLKRTTLATALPWIAGVLALAAFVLSFYFYGSTTRSGSNDSLDYASMGRNLTRGEGFSTSTIYPLQLSEAIGLASSEDFNQRRVPNLHRPPLLPLIYAMTFRIVGDSPVIFPLVSSFFYLWVLFFVWFTCRWATSPAHFRSSDSLKVSYKVTIVGAVALYPPLVRQIPLGLAEIPIAVVCLALVSLLLKNNRNASRVFAIGLLCGSGFLFKSYFLILLPSLALFLWCEGAGRAGWRTVTYLFLGWLMVSSPWLIRNWIVAGSPFFTLQAYCEISKGIPGYEFFRPHRGLEPLSTLQFFLNHPREVSVKAIHSIFVCARSDLGMIPLIWIGGLFCWWRLKASEPIVLHRVIGLLLVLNALLVVTLAPINLEPRYLLPTLLPLLALSLIGMFGRREGNMQDKVLLGILAIFTAANLTGFYRSPTTLDRGEDASLLMTHIAQDGLVLTDADSYVAWFADRPAIWLPADDEAMEWVLDRFPVEGVYLQDGPDSPYLRHYKAPTEILSRLEGRFRNVVETPSGGVLVH